MPANRNQFSHYDNVPTLAMSRSRFPLSHTVKFSANVGELIPVDCWECLPGDTFRVRTNKVIRLQTLLAPIMDNLYVDFFAFYAPARILSDHWKNFYGESERAWYPQTTYTVPTIESAGDHKFVQGSIADYLGIPPETDHLKVNALPFRMYAMIVNEFFRDQNLQDPIPVYTGDSMQTAARDRSTLDSYARGGLPWIAAKKHDVFTSCTPGPIKAATPVRIPDGFVNLQAPLIANSTLFNTLATGQNAAFWQTGSGNTSISLNYSTTGGNITAQTTGTNSAVRPLNLGIDTMSLAQSEGDFHNEVINGTIEQLRMAFQINKLLFRDMLGGSRYRELLRQHFNVVSPDASMQIPQYIGGNRFPVIVHQIANTGESENAKLGNVGAMSVTTDSHEDFTFSCSEPGYIMVLAVMRYDHTYSQGLHRMWSKQTRYDFYWPELANIGNQPVYTKEVDCRYGNYTWTDGQGTVHEGNEVFGYQEAWYDYRYIPDRCSAEMRPGVSNTLASWHLGDYYADQPRLSPDWIQEDKNNVDRALAVTSSVANQYWADVYFQVDATRPMPVYSIPGLADHM